MTDISRRAALGGMALLPIAGTAAAPSPRSGFAELVADWKMANAEYLASVDHLDGIEADHPEIAKFWPRVDVGFGLPSNLFPSGIDHELRKVANQLRESYGEIPEVQQASALLARFSQIAQAKWEKLWTDCHRLKETCGIAEAERLSNAAADRERASFDAIVLFSPSTDWESAEKSRFLLEYLMRYPGERSRLHDAFAMTATAEAA